jgi:hypothetical protein
MLRLLRRPLAFAACLAASAAARPALAAGNADACIAASEHAQELRNAGKLTAARDELMVCSRAECPKLVQTDCTKWMGEVLAALPSVVPGAKDPNGKDVVEAKFSIDGEVVLEALDGKPVPVDTGVHVFRLEAAGMKPVEERVVVRAGEQNRVVSWQLEPAASAPPPAPPAEDHGAAKHEPALVVPIVLSGAGIVLMGLALLTDLGATSDAHELRDTCAPNCDQDDVDSIKGRYALAGLGAGLGAAALITGGIVFFATRSSSSGIAVSPLVTGGAVAQGRISF